MDDKASAERSPKRTKSPRSRKKVDEMTATEETQEIVDSGLPQLEPRRMKEILIESSTDLTWDNDNAKHITDTGYLSLPFHKKVTIDADLKGEQKSFLVIVNL